MSDFVDLSGKVAIITGASRGIGQAIAERYAEGGAKVVLSSRKQDALDAVAGEFHAKGYDVLPVAAHNGDREALYTLVERTIDAFGAIDVLVNNAATNPHFGTMLEAEDSYWQKTIQVNVMGNIWLTQQVVKAMKEQGNGGKIVNIASVNGLRPGNFQGIYSMTKAAVISITQTLAMELASYNIQVNAIAPGLIKTKFAQVLWANEGLLQNIIERTPVGRIGEPDDITGLAVFLASKASAFVTGQVFVVDGGLSIPML